MVQNRPRQTDDDREVISYETLIEGRLVLVAIDRVTIEVWLGRETTSSEERLALVNQDMRLLSRCAKEALKDAPDASGIMLKIDHLPKRDH